MEQCTKAIGEMIFSMAKELKHGLTKVSMKETMSMGGNMESGHTYGMMAASIPVTGEKIKLVGRAFIRG
jgi:hypothetical protein